MQEAQAAEAACGGNIQENARPCKPFFAVAAFFLHRRAPPRLFLPVYLLLQLIYQFTEFP